MLTALQGHFIQISSKVRKLRRERERSVSTAVSAAGQTMTEPEKSSDLGEISAVTVRLGQLPADSSVYIFSHCSAVTQKPKAQDQHGVRRVTIIMLGQRNH